MLDFDNLTEGLGKRQLERQTETIVHWTVLFVRTNAWLIMHTASSLYSC